MNKPMTGPLTVSIPLPRVVDDELAGDMEKESVFVSPYLDHISIDEDHSTATLHLRVPDHVEEVMDKSKRYLEVMAKRLTGFDVKVFLENKRKDDMPYEVDVTDELVSRGWVYDYGKGQVAYSGPVLKLARLVNERAGELYERQFQALDGHFPAFVDGDTLHKCGYFDSHPNAITFVGNVIEDFDALEEFRVANSCSQGAVLPPQEHIHMGGMCLNPAACFPAYPTLAGKTIEDGHVVSWLGRVFRYESRNISGLDRLFEFNVREIVFVGSEDYVRDCRQKALPLVSELSEYFDLDMTLQTASDPFFATVAAAKKFWQQSQEVKNEIMIPVLDSAGEKKLLACGSVNLHGDFFGQKFDIKSADGSAVQTGCIGLGIERWVLACFTQHGFDPKRWPDPVRAVVFG